MVAAAGLGRAWQTPGVRDRVPSGPSRFASRRSAGSDALDAGPVPDLRTSEALWTHALDHGANRSAMRTITWDWRCSRGGARGGGGPIHRSAAAEPRLRPGLQQPGIGARPPREARRGGSSLHRGAVARAQLHQVLQQPGIGAARGGEACRAAALYAEALRREPDNTMARFCLGLVLYKQGRLDEAITELSEVLRHEPDNAVARSNLGTRSACKAGSTRPSPSCPRCCGTSRTMMSPAPTSARRSPSGAGSRRRRGCFVGSWPASPGTLAPEDPGLAAGSAGPGECRGGPGADQPRHKQRGAALAGRHPGRRPDPGRPVRSVPLRTGSGPDGRPP